ncbi:hypothetical protein B0H17DRAFT_1202696 [Mycena rosella]|uniref:Uncharacterized protein n=1 Tax=Mycena rosella TaxID=1033263 RepID=A0AAD7DG88_MYCRO|nr:hypothetical protein B0H17DRAFT_1202696 [Mycena rosella]
MIPLQETRRLFGPVNRPDRKTNVRHRAILRKALELFSEQELLAVFTEPIHLRVVMGSALTFNQLGKITTHYQHNGCLVTRETNAPKLEARVALHTYRAAYKLYFMSRGSDYTAAEQAWHDWIVPYLAARERSTRPDWAFQPLPGLQRMQGFPPPPPARTHARAHVPAPTPARAPVPAPRADTLPVQTLPRRLCLPLHALPLALQSPIHLLHPVLALLGACPTHPALAPPGTAPAQAENVLGGVDISDSEEDLPRMPKKRTRKFLGVVDISDSEEEDACPRKKTRV